MKKPFLDKNLTAQNPDSRIPVLIEYTALAVIFLFAFRKICDADIWFHLRAGAYIFDNRALPVVDSFTFTANLPWVTHEWLSELVLYLSYTHLGIVFPATGQAILVLVLFLALRKIMMTRGAGPEARTVALLCAFAFSRYRINMRPEMWSYLFIVLFYFILSGRNAGKLMLISLIMILWANLHAGCIFGLIVIFLRIAAVFFEGKFSGGDPRALRTEFPVLAVAVASSLVNPMTYQTLLNPMQVFFRGTSDILQVKEYLNMFNSDGLVQRLIFFAVVAGLFFFNYRKIKVFDFILSVFFGAFALLADRNFIFFALMSAPLLAVSIQGAFETRHGMWRGMEIKALLAALILTVSVFRFVQVDYFRQRVVGFGVTKYLDMPDGAINFLKKEKMGGNVFVDNFDWGDYVIWRGYPELLAFIDGRNEIFSDDVHKAYAEIITGGAGWEGAINKYNAEFALLRHSRRDAPGIRDYIFAHKDWALIYWDDISLLYARKNGRLKERVERMTLGPANPDIKRFSREIAEKRADRKWLDETEMEMKTSIERAPLSLRTHNNLGLVKFCKEDFDGAINEFNQAVSEDHFITNLHFNLAVCLLKKERTTEAIEEFKKELKGNPGNKNARLYLDQLSKNRR